MHKKGRSHLAHRSVSRAVIQRLWQRLPSGLRSRAAGHANNEPTSAELDTLRERDRAQNVETAPPEDEYVDLRCMWAVEFYTPSHVDKLVDNFRTLGWHKSALPLREDPASWVRATRQLPLGGSWLNLGTIRSVDDTGPWQGSHRTAPMPRHVRHARGGLFSLTPSLTGIVMCFVFEDDFRSCLDQALRRDRQTVTRASRRGYEILDPERQKREEVQLVRGEITSLAARWFREHLPGVFSCNLLAGQLPTYELLTLHKAEPFPKRAAKGRPPTYLRVLDLQSAPSVWSSTYTPNLKWSFRPSERDLRCHSVLAIRDTDIDGEQPLKTYGGLPGLHTYVDAVYQEVIAKLAIEHLLDGYNRSLNRLRDTVTTGIRRLSRRRPIHTLESLVDKVPYEVDIAAVTTDLIASAEESPWFFRALAGFELSGNRQSQDSLATHFCSAVKRHATRLKETDRSLRDHLTQIGSLVAATVDIRTQREIRRLTVIVTGLTFLVAILALGTFLATDPGSALTDWLRDFWP